MSLRAFWCVCACVCGQQGNVGALFMCLHVEDDVCFMEHKLRYVDKTEPHEPLHGRNTLCSHAHKYLNASIVKTIWGEKRCVFSQEVLNHQRYCIIPHCVFWPRWALGSQWSLWMRSSLWSSSYWTSDSCRGNRPYCCTPSCPHLRGQGWRKQNRIFSVVKRQHSVFVGKWRWIKTAVHLLENWQFKVHPGNIFVR